MSFELDIQVVHLQISYFGVDSSIFNIWSDSELEKCFACQSSIAQETNLLCSGLGRSSSYQEGIKSSFNP